MGSADYTEGFNKVKTLPHRLNSPLKRSKPTRYFVNSMSDLFHEDVPVSFIRSIIKVIENTPWHQYQILTKRPERMRYILQMHPIPPNAWLGVTVENRLALPRIKELTALKAYIRFLSIEPLLEDLGDIDLSGIHWVICGGESGAKARPMEKDWANNIKEQCSRQQVKFFFKQWGTWKDGIKKNKAAHGRELGGKIYDAIPEVDLHRPGNIIPLINLPK